MELGLGWQGGMLGGLGWLRLGGVGLGFGFGLGFGVGV